MRSGWVAAGIALAIAAAAPACAQEWTLAAQTRTSSFLVYVDPAKRVSGPAELRQVTALMVKQISPKSVGQVASINDWEFNCTARTWRWVASRAINSKGDHFSSEWKPTEWTPLKQDAMGYMSGFACGDTKPIGPEFPGLKAAIDGLWKEEAAPN